MKEALASPKDAALKLALDVLERYQVGKWQDFDTFEEAITAIKAALAQGETSSPRAANCAECGKKDSDGWALYCVECMDKVKTLSAQPAQQRHWGKPRVSLTDEEIHDTEGYDESRKMFRFAHALIAKMMEKNT